MGFFQKFPYTDEHQLNLDWILRLFKTLHGGSTGQVLKKRSGKDFDWEWGAGGGGGGSSDYNDLSNKPQINGNTLSGNKTTAQLGIYVPSPSSATPQALGTPNAGSSGDFSRADHVHAKPTYSKSDVGLGNVDNVQQYSANNPPPYPVTSVNGQTGAVSLSIPSSASDVGAVASNQGSGNAGKFLGIANDGAVTPENLPVDPDAKTNDMTQSVGVDSSGKLWTAPGGGSSAWTTLYDNTTTAEAVLQIAVTNFSVKEIEVYFFCPKASANYDTTVYIPLNRSDGTHWQETGYQRMLTKLHATTGSDGFTFAAPREVTIDGVGWFDHFNTVSGSESNIKTKVDIDGLTNTVVGMTYTSISIATLVAVPAGTKIIVRGR